MIVVIYTLTLPQAISCVKKQVQNSTIPSILKHVPVVPKHMKGFETLITFDSTKISGLLFLSINVL